MSGFQDVEIKQIMKTENIPVIKRADPIKEIIPFPEGGSHAWVVEKDGSKKLAGVVTDHDILSVLSPEKSTYILGFPDMRSLCANCAIENIMTKDIIKTSPDETIGQALRKMVNHRISRLPVIDRDGNIVGEVFQSHITDKFSETIVDFD